MEDKFLGLILSFPRSLLEPLEGLLYLLVPWGWEELESTSLEEQKVQIFFTTPQELEETVSFLKSKFPQIKTETFLLPKQDWLENWKKFFTPIQIENTFEILPTWEKSKSNLLPLFIYPEMAFGTGHHPTTYLCLKVIAQLHQNNLLTSKDTFLDVGTGSGILGIACAKLGLTGIGLDIDPHAINNARHNIKLNQVQDSFSLELGSLKKLNIPQKFSLILANILATPLIKMREEILKHLQAQGKLILSGILKEQASKVKEAYLQSGLKLTKEFNSKEWVALLFSYD